MVGINLNPMLTTNGLGQFRLTSDGYVQGVAMDDPAIRNELAGGILAGTETLPMFGGIGIFEDVSGGTQVNGTDTLGGNVGRASSIATLTGFSVFNQNHAWIQTPTSKVPVAAPGMTVGFYRLGSGIRIPLQCSTALVSLQGGLITQQVSWDFNQQVLIPYVAPYAANVTTAAVWSATNGGQVTFTTTSAHGVAVGDLFTISGFTPAGYNADYIAQAGTTGSTLVGIAYPDQQTVTPGAVTVEGTLVAGGGALPVKVLNVNIGNSKTVVYDPLTGLTNWNNNGSAALVQL